MDLLVRICSSHLLCFIIFVVNIVIVFINACRLLHHSIHSYTAHVLLILDIPRLLLLSPKLSMVIFGSFFNHTWHHLLLHLVLVDLLLLMMMMLLLLEKQLLLLLFSIVNAVVAYYELWGWPTIWIHTSIYLGILVKLLGHLLG